MQKKTSIQVRAPHTIADLEKAKSRLILYWILHELKHHIETTSRRQIDIHYTELLTITRAEMLDLMEKIPALVKMIRLMDERNAIANQRRLSSTIINRAEKSYEEFAGHHPQFIQRFPQHIIAYYLGITKETLSRIRSQALK